MLKVALVVFVGTALGREWPSVEEGAGESSLLENMPLPCSCNAYPKLVDLGHGHYPRYVTSIECKYESCWTSPYHCHERTYKLKVLRPRDEMDEVLSKHDLNLPEALRPTWKFVIVEVAVACQCSR